MSSSMLSRKSTPVVAIAMPESLRSISFPFPVYIEKSHWLKYSCCTVIRTKLLRWDHLTVDTYFCYLVRPVL